MPLGKREHYLTEHLPEFIASRLHAPFAWGSNDCALFAADAVEAITGVDIAEDFRGKYTTKLGAIKAIKEITGGSTVEDAAVYCAEKHGLKEHEYPLLAKRGDLVIVRNNLGEKVAGIVGLNGRHVYVPGDDGLVQFSILDVIRSWSVGDAHEWTPPKWHKQAR
jgi:hypothetical protein